MLLGIRQKVKIQPGGVIELKSSELISGRNAEVIVIMENDESKNESTLVNIIGSLKGCYTDSLKADKFIREERDRWE